MARHVCQDCGATVAGDEQFCPTCGSYIEPELAPVDDYEQFELGATPPPPDPGRGSSRQTATVICPSCGAANQGNRHCEECGARLSQGPLPAAPRPAVQATAGVRAVIAIGGLLLGVILIALLFRLFGDDDASAATSLLAEGTTSTTLSQVQPDVLDPLSIDCNVEPVGSFGCNNLTTGPGTLYQVNWAELEQTEETLTITIRFRMAVAISQIDWTNITDDDVRFRRNYRARALSISSDDTFSAVQRELQNVPGTQTIPFSSVVTNQVTIEVNSAWNAELIDDQVPFEELAIDEIQVIGRPANITTAPTDSTTAPTGDTTGETTPATTGTTGG